MHGGHFFFYYKVCGLRDASQTVDLDRNPSMAGLAEGTSVAATRPPPAETEQRGLAVKVVHC